MPPKKISINDFSFSFVGYGHYEVTYISPVKCSYHTKIISDMEIIDATKNSESPMRKDLELLKKLVKL